MIFSSLSKNVILFSKNELNRSTKLNLKYVQKIFKNSFKSIAKNPDLKLNKSFINHGQHKSKLVIKYGLFTIIFTGLSFTASPLIVYERMRAERARNRVQTVQKYSEFRLEVILILRNNISYFN